MDTAEYLDGIRANSALFVVAARQAGAGTAVPTCPEWTVADLAVHQGRVYRWMSAIVETRSQEPVHPKVGGEPADGEDPISWLEIGAERALAVLGAVDPDTLIWNWSDGGPGPARFWFRRMAHEVVIHRSDAEAAAGRQSGVEPAEMASDGIDEMLHLLEVRARFGPVPSLAGSYHFHTTDVPGEWVIEFGADGTLAVRREHAKAGVAVRGPAGALELFLYNRRGPADLEIFGDEAMVAAWTDQIRF
jgi:uncharacterized protein (TIGR03083 family)